MYNFKKVLAMVLAVVMMLSVAVVAFAGEDEDSHKFVYSPTKGDTTTYNTKGEFGVYTETHKNGDTIAFNSDDKYSQWHPAVTDVAAKKAGAIINIAGMVTGYGSDYDKPIIEKVQRFVGFDSQGKPQYVEDEITVGYEQKLRISEIEKIGSGDYGIGANDEGQNVTGLNVKSKAPKVTVSSRALADSKIANVVVDADNVLIEKNATKGTKAKTIAFAFPQMTKSKQLVVKKGAFNGAKKVRIVVSPKMTSKELKKLKKRLKKQLGAAAYKKVKIVRG